MHKSLPTNEFPQSDSHLPTASLSLRISPKFPTSAASSQRTNFDASHAAVVVVDPWGDTEEVLGTVLRRCGHRTRWVRSWHTFQHNYPRDEAQVIVLDAELLEPTELDAAARFAQSASENSPRLVILGRLCGPSSGADGVLAVSKPYCVAWLVRKIEELLAGSGSAHLVARAA